MECPGLYLSSDFTHAIDFRSFRVIFKFVKETMLSAIPRDLNCMSDPEKPSEAEFFSGEKVKFSGVAQHAWLIGNKLGNRTTNPARAMASWLPMA
jgi:hypothetical protein